MYELIKLFFDIAIFKKGPQDVPASPWLLRLMFLVYILVNYLILMMNTDWFNALTQVMVEVILFIVFSWGVLFLTGRLERYQQTASALLGTDALISFFAIPALATLINRGSIFAFIAFVLLILWHWAVTGHILSHALSKPLVFALGVAFLYILATHQVMGLLFPGLTSIE